MLFKFVQGVRVTMAACRLVALSPSFFYLVIYVWVGLGMYVHYESIASLRKQKPSWNQPLKLFFSYPSLLFVQHSSLTIKNHTF